MFEAVVTAVQNKLGDVVEKVTGLKDKVTGALSGAGTWLTEIGKNINHLASASGEIAGNITKVAETAHNTSTGRFAAFSLSFSNRWSAPRRTTSSTDTSLRFVFLAIHPAYRLLSYAH